MIQTDYYGFRQLYREALGRGAAISQTDDSRWRDYIAAHSINEFGALAIARGRMSGPVPVIVALGEDRDGFYVYSEDDEICLRLVFQD